MEELRYILEDSQATALVVQNAELWERLALPEQRSVFASSFSWKGEPADGVIGWEAFWPADGHESPDPDEPASDAAAAGRHHPLHLRHHRGGPRAFHSPTPICCIRCAPWPVWPIRSPGSPVLSVLPIWHAYERSASYYFLSCACSQTYTTIKQLKKDLPRVKPVIAMATVPRLWEAVQAGFEDVVKTFPPRQRLLRRPWPTVQAAAPGAATLPAALLLESPLQAVTGLAVWRLPALAVACPGLQP